MSRRRWFSILALLSACPAVAGSIPADAATPHAHLSLAHSSVTSGAKDKFSYRVTGKGTIELQRTFGTARAFRTVEKLHGHSGKGSFTTPEMGTYDYRVVLRNSKDKVLAASSATLLKSYSSVSLGTLIHQSSKTTQIGGNLYRYVFSDLGGRTERVLKRNETSCRSVSLNFGLKQSKYNTQKPGTGSIKIVQETADEVSATATLNQVGQVSAKLTGDAFNINAYANEYYGELYINGTASCYTTNGKP